MSLIHSILREILSLFVDDGSLALQALGLVLAVAVLVKAIAVAPLVGGCLLIIGCLVILAFSLRRKLRR